MRNTDLLGELLHLALLDLLVALILAALLCEQIVLELEHVIVSLDHFSIVVVGSLVLYVKLFAEGESLVQSLQCLVITAQEMAVVSKLRLRGYRCVRELVQEGWNSRRTSRSLLPSHR